MLTRDEEFLQRLQAAFAIEAGEHVEAMAAGLLDIEGAAPEGADPQVTVEAIYRESHSLKGAARAVNRLDIEAVCQALESVFAAWKRQEVQPSPGLFDHLHAAVDLIGQLLATPAENAEQNEAITPLTRQLARLAAGETPAGKAFDIAQSDSAQPDGAAQNGTAAKNAVSNGPSKSTAAKERDGAEQPVLDGGSEVVARSDPALPATTEGVTHLNGAPAPASGTTPVRPDTPDGAPTLSTLPPSNATEAQSAPQAPSVMPGRAGRGDAAGLSETVRIATSKLDALLLQAEEMLVAKLTARQRVAELRALAPTLERWRKEWAKVSLDARAIRQWASSGSEEAGLGATHAPSPGQMALLLDFLDWNEDYFRTLESRLSLLSRAAERDGRAVGGMVDMLLNNAKKLLMLPFATLLGLFPRLVRDLSRDQGKDVHFFMHGGEVEIDKRILEEMKDPLIHLLRNSVDHGIETPEARVRAGKPARAEVSLEIQQTGDKVEITIADDGAGIDIERVKAAALKKGAISPEEAARLSPEEALWLIFTPDVSTSPMITEISGRGLGMSIVREKVEGLGGRIRIQTQVGQGTTFHIVLPLTLATFEGILVQTAGQIVVVPTAGVECVARVRRSELQTVENHETVLVKGHVTPLTCLSAILELPPAPLDKNEREEAAIFATILVLTLGEERMAFEVDAIINEQEVLVKPLGKPLVRVRNVTGATILGTGKAVPVLNVADLLQSAIKMRAMRRPDASAPSRTQALGAEGKRPAVLIAEDSITSRLLLKSILEAAGYEVTAAVDGADAFEALQGGEFALVCSDVDMPRLNGFDLTTKIRADPRLADLPVVLVTSRESPEDKERGIDVGANAYVIKSGFDQSRLLEIVRRLA